MGAMEISQLFGECSWSERFSRVWLVAIGRFFAEIRQASRDVVHLGELW
jgi:hypothetical protein